ncbi:MAG: sigma-54-dependent Fis family transcriptional regulator [Chitinivibrionia bacterium]|nr:sigma-54-dependent Fis family transcriptional regulator [Chitinivibrionia bacterium]
MSYILIASTNQGACSAVQECFGSEHTVEVVSDKEKCLELFRRRRYEFLFIDVGLLGATLSVKECSIVLHPFHMAYPTSQIIVMSPQEKIREAVMTVKAGANNYLAYPINPEEVAYVAQSLYESQRMESELHYLRSMVWKSDSFEIAQTRSPVMQKVFEKIRSVAETRSTVLLYGETGTGKDVLARLIHRNSRRGDKQFIPVHCGAIPDTLLESELFGHEKGAFTGAHRRKLGRFEIAHEGTIFLDEIGTITPPAQVRLLRVLQDRTFHRVGGEQSIEVDVRVIAATNIDIGEMIQAGAFRSDLYYRLSVFPIEVPPVRERREDIPLFTQAFLERLNNSYAKGIHEIHPEAMEAFMSYSWPGNIRELENLMERGYILEMTSSITPESLPMELLNSAKPHARVHVDVSTPLAEARRRGTEDIEKQYLKELLTLHNGRIKTTAEAAGITPRQLHKLMKKHGIRKEDFKSSEKSERGLPH